MNNKTVKRIIAREGLIILVVFLMILVIYLTIEIQDLRTIMYGNSFFLKKIGNKRLNQIKTVYKKSGGVIFRLLSSASDAESRVDDLESRVDDLEQKFWH